jgi:hypothetical protein
MQGMKPADCDPVQDVEQEADKEETKNEIDSMLSEAREKLARTEMARDLANAFKVDRAGSTGRFKTEKERARAQKKRKQQKQSRKLNKR